MLCELWSVCAYYFACIKIYILSPIENKFKWLTIFSSQLIYIDIEMKEAGDYRPGKCRVFPESVIVNTTFNARIYDA